MRLLLLATVLGCSGTHQSSPDAAADTAIADAAPAPLPDPRFKFVAAFASISASETSTGVGLGLGTSAGAFSPVTTGGGDSWVVYELVPTVPLVPTDSWVEFEVSADQSDLDTIERTKIVTSLDFTGDAFAVSAIAPADATDLEVEGSIVADATSLATFISARGNKIVTTAVAFDGSGIEVVGYGYVRAPQTYETTTLTADGSTIGSQAAALAADGYTITAFGRASATTYALVGTRPTGVTTPRETVIAGDQNATSGPKAADLLAQGYAIVGGYADATTGAPQLILER